MQQQAHASQIAAQDANTLKGVADGAQTLSETQIGGGKQALEQLLGVG